MIVMKKTDDDDHSQMIVMMIYDGHYSLGAGTTGSGPVVVTKQ